ncbi:MAG: phosphoenolpyruvate synthase regulatory protein [Rhodospirillaceae bacterium]|nr:phosphoenolpyruvate synthase regulatory protein [Rhodospirillaceae bacterium]
MSESFHIHLVSDSTGETTQGVMRASIAQFEGVEPREHIWPMVRSTAQMELVIEGIRENPGPVVFTLVSSRTRQPLVEECARLRVPCVSVLEPVIGMFARYFNQKTVNRPGGQHTLNAEYFDRIDALHFVMAHDDGQATEGAAEADLILIGVSRTSKTPTSIYLANHYGLKTANIPFVPGIPLPENLFNLNSSVIGLTASADRLIQIRRNRLLMLHQEPETDYVDIETVKAEISDARKLFSKNAWPVIDVTRRSIEETAAAIYQLYSRFHDETNTGET